MKKLILEGYLVVPDKDLDAVQAELPKHVALTREEPGCLVFNCEQDPEFPNRFIVYEEFISHEAFDAHQDRVKTSTWGDASKSARREYSIKAE